MVRTAEKPIVGIAAKVGHPRSIEVCTGLIEWLRQRKMEFRVDSHLAEGLTHASSPIQIPTDCIVERSQLPIICDPIVILGGDGTLISVCRFAGERSPTIIGVNLGTLGFLTEITIPELYRSLESAIEKRAVLERRSLLDVTITHPNKPADNLAVLNDVVITKGALARIFGVEFFVNDQFAGAIHGDGMLVATPGASTAYSLAAGGSIVHPQVDAILVTPICPHSLTTRPLVLPGRSKIKIRIAASSYEDEVFITADGQQGMALRYGDEVEVTTSPKSVLFAKSTVHNYFQILATKLKWANA